MSSLLTRSPPLTLAQRDHIHTIQDALAHISHPQPVQVTHPSRPGVTLEASQQVLIEALPQILVLHMKRFCYDTAVGGVVKVGKQIRFGAELEIGGGTSSRRHHILWSLNTDMPLDADLMAPGVRRAQPTRYKLFGGKSSFPSSNDRCKG
jgi:ubiquitin carboxyl-terminal hydrolase 10